MIVESSNGRFQGTLEIYLAPDEHLEIANVLSGFPSCTSDSRSLEVGTFNPDHADGGLRIELRCADSSGHVLADIKVRATVARRWVRLNPSALRMRIEPAAIDSFVQQLKTMDVAVGASAFMTASA